MNIRASRIDDLRRAREEYDLGYKGLADEAAANDQRYRNAVASAEKSLENQVSDLIGPTNLELRIRAEEAWVSRGGWSVRVNANDDKKFDTSTALAWDWSATIDSDGNVVKDSGSWSGLKAVTPEQLDDLEESVRVLRILNNIDWDTVLHIANINYDDYYDKDLSKRMKDMKNARPNFEDDMLQAQLEDLVNQDIAVKLSSDSDYRGEAGILITSISPKSVTGYIFPWRFVEGKSADELRKYAYAPRRTSKSKIVLDSDGNIITETIL